ncbi:MAG: type I-E CRISPR-associated protein Cas5/CasD [Hydrogenophaga sp.]|uniref:type I-E CRISPR-associated protein Cas5/CasD n=1 Tax=Hydrogenophaga sp. TaxID=1904254 RepID=UPI002722F162|nr:type I-E CRISPR-associated protein Cas5/CasD [Hydrogenophaga sp.]MDO9483719.1 type I-E CRISPR-associated protein Cas5/CasD [Hydrogenophaga sp.]MDP2221968.1 type I-E CRISPR-associated protein Cas5/CasD [Hydrogenophaga sp.]MDP3344408.1 type I-E CRISPR-associated protein Cas5/CasD [Hydrogenophaga sp.]MDP3925741.1 type I-E CRISPR-associated protein Cas5/CasD [Hydrogenophaga sp.]
MVRHLLMRLRAPLIAFGGETIDNYGVIRDFPALSMVTGLLANALGWDRGDDVKHNRLQERLVMGARLEADGERLVDFQTAQLQANDKGWTTRGMPEERAGGAGSYAGPHLRYRHYHADMDVLIALRLQPADETPTLDDLAFALDKPARPLFLGRKNCLPTVRLLAGWIEADSILDALQKAEPIAADPVRAQWPDGEGQLPGDRLVDVCDERNWTSGVHGGWRPVREGLIKNAGNTP